MPAEGPDGCDDGDGFERAAHGQACHEASDQQEAGGQREADKEGGAGFFSEQSRGGAHANQGVVFFVLVGVDCVVKQGPGDACQIEQHGGRSEGAGMGGPAQQRAPVEGKAEEDLRPPCEAFGEGVDGDGDESGDAKCDGEGVEAEQDRECQQRLQDHPEGCAQDADLARGDRAGFGAGDFGVDMAV